MAKVKSVVETTEAEAEVEVVAEVKEAAPAPKEAPKKEVSWFLKDAK
jgi:hypothetical protein